MVDETLKIAADIEPVNVNIDPDITPGTAQRPAVRQIVDLAVTTAKAGGHVASQKFREITSGTREKS